MIVFESMFRASRLRNGGTDSASCIDSGGSTGGGPLSVRDGQVTTVYLAPRYATAIRMPEAINSVVVGDPGSFSAEHSDREPQLVFVKPITPKPAQTNLLISTTRGLQVSLLLVSRGEPKGDQEADIDFLNAIQAIRAIHHSASGASISRCPPYCDPYQRGVRIGSAEGRRPGRAYRAQEVSQEATVESRRLPIRPRRN